MVRRERERESKGSMRVDMKRGCRGRYIYGGRERKKVKERGVCARRMVGEEGA